MGDPISALSLGANVIQVVEVSFRLVSSSRAIYQSVDGSLAENLDTETLATDLQDCNAILSQSLAKFKSKNAGSTANWNPADSVTTLVPEPAEPSTWDAQEAEALQNLCEDCNRIATLLIQKLRHLKVDPNVRWRELKSLKQALKTVWSKEELDATANRLNLYRTQLNTRILVSLRLQFEQMNLNQGQILARIDNNSRRTLQTLEDQRGLLSEDMEIQSNQISRLIKMENEKTRQLLSTVILRDQQSSTPPPQEVSANEASVNSLPGTSSQGPFNDTSNDVPLGVTSPLHQFVKDGNKRSVRDLLRDPNTDLNALDEAGRSPLHIACLYGHVDIAKYLRTKGAAINNDDDSGNTPLHYAAMNGHIQLVQFLLTRGADKDIENDENKAPSFYTKDNFVLSWMFEHGPNLELSESENGRTALIEAARRGDIDSLRCLLDIGANIHGHNSQGLTAIHEACEHGTVEAAQFLLSRGANINATKHDNWVPLSCAAHNNRIKAVEFLIDQGADMEIQNTHAHHTALAEANYKGHWDVARLLVERGANVNARDLNGWSYLHYASQRDSISDIRLALEKGADVNLGTAFEGQTARDIAMSKGYHAIVELLQHS